MARSSQDSSSTRASHNYRSIRRVRNSENRRTTDHLPSHVQRHIHRRGCPPRMSVQFIGTTHIHPAIPTRDPPANRSFVMHFHTHIHTHATRPPCLRTNVNPFADTGRGTGVRIPEYSSPGNNPQPPLSFRGVPSTHVNEFTGVQTPAVGYHQQTQNNDGFISGARMNAVWPGAVTGGYNPGEPGAGLTPGVQTPAGSSGVGYNQLSPIATSGFAGQTSQAPIVPEYDTQAAAPPPTLDQQLFPTSWATAANNVFAEDFLPPAVSDSFMHMLDQIFRV